MSRQKTFRNHQTFFLFKVQFHNFLMFGYWILCRWIFCSQKQEFTPNTKFFHCNILYVLSLFIQQFQEPCISRKTTSIQSKKLTLEAFSLFFRWSPPISTKFQNYVKLLYEISICVTTPCFHAKHPS